MVLAYQKHSYNKLGSRSSRIWIWRSSIIEHHITTEPGKKVKLRPYRIPEARRAAIEQDVQKMLALGVIEESYSEWTSPVVLVPKPDRRNRFCNDFRKLNEIV